ncbi:MAG: hypothetical protein KC473_01185 [Candidatus Dadabacteria bacterium]|nr:hypothetical protein [Candidatus Dadabacteria bacterium]
MNYLNSNSARIILVLIGVLLIYGCNPKVIPPSASNYSKGDNQITIDKSFEEIWPALIEFSSTSFFVIRNFEKDSGLLTLDFSTDPSEFIDCGSLEVPLYNYNGPTISAFERWGYAELDGSMNVFVKPISPNVTQISVNARYVFTGNSGGEGEQVWTFDTGGSDTKPIGVVSITCQPTHKAENAILQGIEQASQEPNT